MIDNAIYRTFIKVAVKNGHSWEVIPKEIMKTIVGKRSISVVRSSDRVLRSLYKAMNPTKKDFNNEKIAILSVRYGKKIGNSVDPYLNENAKKEAEALDMSNSILHEAKQEGS